MTSEPRSELRRLGAAGPMVFPLALGCMGMSARIEQAIPASAVAGTRYDEHQMKMLDSER